MASFVFQPASEPACEVCPRARRFWCGDVRCGYRHNFETCHNFQNNKPCNVKNCRFLHITATEEQRYKENQILTPIIISESLRLRQMAGGCRIEGCERNRCRHHHDLSARELEPLICPFCLKRIRKYNLAIYESCGHTACEACNITAKEVNRIPELGKIACPLCRRDSLGERCETI